MPIRKSYIFQYSFFKQFTNSGFTLVELMVVMAIIAILASVGFTTYTSSQRAGRDSKRIADIQEIQKASEQYFAVNHKYPTSVTAESTPSFYSYFENQDPPLDPDGTAYTYSHNLPGSGGTCSQDRYVLCTQLENCAGGKCTAAALITDGCASPADTTPPTTSPGYYCVSALSN